ncbi:hypothetical protein LQW54_003483 [Pestalotiopsis sp. IQ-011]
MAMRGLSDPAAVTDMVRYIASSSVPEYLQRTVSRTKDGLVPRSASGLRSAHQVRNVWCIGTVTGWPSSTSEGHTGEDPEQIFEDWNLPEPTGYGQSKFICERLLDAAGRESDIPAVHLGVLPASLGLDVIDWVPVDVLGRVVVDLALSAPTGKKPGAAVYHVANPRRTSWREVLETVEHELGAQGNVVGLETVPLGQWVEALRKSSSEMDAAGMAQVPAAKILDFFEGLADRLTAPVLLDTTEAVAASPTLANLEPIDKTLVENWMRQWSF